jgi:hypothetical protein
MRLTGFILLIFLVISCESSNSIPTTSKKINTPLLNKTEFRFVCTKQVAFPSKGKKDIADTYGVFTFRYENSLPIKFFGFAKPMNGEFKPRFTSYKIYKNNEWKMLPIGYCGTGAETFILQPGVDYEMHITLAINNFKEGDLISLSLDSQNGEFWSEPFQFNKL